jgi:hypothetical protein
MDNHFLKVGIGVQFFHLCSDFAKKFYPQQHT